MADGRRDPEAWLRQAWERGAPSPLGAALSLLAVGYRLALIARERTGGLPWLAPGRLPCPVISIGNLTVGGSGKTPVVELAARTLADWGAVPAVVSRGYGRRTRGVQVVADRQAVRLPPRAGGDEPVLLARRLPGIPVVVGENRYEAGRQALALGATMVVLDDGFQNRTVAKDLEILVVSGRSPWGNRRLFPRGPLREPLSAVRRAHLVVVTRTGAAAEMDAVTGVLERHGCRAPVVAVRYQPAEAWRPLEGLRLPPAALGGRRLLAFAGLAAPQGLLDTLRGLDVRVPELVEFPDHHWYASHEVEALGRRALALGAEGLVTTEKDWVRLGDLPAPAVSLWVLTIQPALDSDPAAWLGPLRATAGASLSGA
jgi:tetraacyldisaccharide 4'-kinase